MQFKNNSTAEQHPVKWIHASNSELIQIESNNSQKQNLYLL